MTNRVLLKKSSVVGKAPSTQDLEYGEVALNFADGKLYYKNSANAITSFQSDLSSYVTLSGTQSLSNKTLVSPIVTNGISIGGTAQINSITYPTDDGAPGQVLSTDGNGQLVFVTISSEGVSGYFNSTITSFPDGDYDGADEYVGASGESVDAFGVSLLDTFNCMDPTGSLQTVELGLLS